MVKWLLVVFSVILLFFCQKTQAQTPTPTIIQFSGYDWFVKPSGFDNPGNNYWSTDNVWLDKEGQLHLKISYIEGKGWASSEVYTSETFGFGQFQFQIIGPIDVLNENVVLGLFGYSTETLQTGTNAIVIEFSRWSDKKGPNAQYSVLPSIGKYNNIAPGVSKFNFSFTLNGLYTTQRFIRTPEKVTFQFLDGHQESDVNKRLEWEVASHTPNLELVPQKPLSVHINLWLYKGQPPTDGKEIEIVIKKFSFTA